MLRSHHGVAPIVHPSCYVDESAQIVGEVEIGENSSVWMNAVVRGDVFAIRIGKNSNVQDCSVLHGMLNKYKVIVGDWVTIGHSVTLHGCTVEDRCLIGMGVVILNTARIGAGSIIAARMATTANTTSVMTAPLKPRRIAATTSTRITPATMPKTIRPILRSIRLP